MNAKPKLLNLFSGVVCGRGYQWAGFHVTDVDIQPFKRYAGDEFVQADAIDYVATHGWKYDAVHASPLCQPHSKARRLAKERAKDHIDYIPMTRFMLESLGLPYIIENVEGAPLRNPIMLCGSMFSGLRTYRHRIFESNVYLMPPQHFPHNDKVPPAGRGKSPKGFFSLTSGGIIGVSKAERLAGMGVDWYVTNEELNQSIPPQFTHYLGLQLMNAVMGRRAAA